MRAIFFLSLILTQIHANNDPELLMHFEFENGSLVCSVSGTTLEYGTDKKARSVVDRCGTERSALNFSGNERLRALSSPHPIGSNQHYTYSVWVRMKDLEYRQRSIMGAGRVDEILRASVLMVHPANQYGYDMTLSFDGNRTMWASAHRLGSEVWVHVAATRAANMIDLFVNGQHVSRGALHGGGGQTILDSSAFWIGSWLGGGSQDWYGEIDDVRVYSGVLTSAQIYHIYAESLCSVETAKKIDTLALGLEKVIEGINGKKSDSNDSTDDAADPLLWGFLGDIVNGVQTVGSVAEDSGSDAVNWTLYLYAAIAGMAGGTFIVCCAYCRFKNTFNAGKGKDSPGDKDPQKGKNNGAQVNGKKV